MESRDSEVFDEFKEDRLFPLNKELCIKDEILRNPVLK
jgi:hypothetical protein